MWCYEVQFSLQFLCICESRFFSQEGTWMASMCVCCFLYNIYSGVGVIWQPSYSMCDWCKVMLFVRQCSSILEEFVYQTTWNQFPANYNFRHLYAAKCGATRYSEVTFYAREIYFCSLCISYVYSNVELLRGKHQKHNPVISFCYCL